MTGDALPTYQGADAWFGPDMIARPSEWIYQLGDEEVAELERTARALDPKVGDILEVSRDKAPLPVLAPALAKMRRDVLHGRGFVLIRGVPVDRLSYRQSAIAFWAIGMHLGEAVPQNARGHTLGHVRDLGYDYSKPTARGYQTNARLPYHCDAGDIVGLLSLKTPRSGGLSSLVSSVTVYNEMVRRRPDLARVLMQPVYRDRRGEVPESRKEWYAIPVFNPHDGRMLVTYVRSAVRKAQRFDEVPRLTPEQEEAMDLLDAIAEDPSVHLDMEFRPGDIQFLNNHTILHSRTAFEDWEEPERKRHLLRLWLASADGPAMPEVFFDFQLRTRDDRPGGIIAPGQILNTPLEVDDGGAGDRRARMFDATARG